MAAGGRPALLLAALAAAAWSAGACPCCPTCAVCYCCPTCQAGTTPLPPWSTTEATTTRHELPPLVCDLNCYGDSSVPVPLPGGDGNGVKVENLEICRSLCRATEGCQAIIYGEGYCWGKKDVRTSKCQNGDGYITEMLTAMPYGTCSISGDPHATTFDERGGLAANSQAITQTEPGEYWLVKSSVLSIQGRFGYSSRFPAAASLTGIAIGGSLILNNYLEVVYIGPVQGPDGFKAFWNRRHILDHGFPAYYNSEHDQLVAEFNWMNPSNFSRQARSTIGGDMGNLPSYLFHITPDIQLYVLLGKETMNAVIIMRKLHVEMDGYCGNFNCVVGDDSMQELERRGVAAPIAAHESLFSQEFPQKQREKHGHRFHLADCTGKLLDDAIAACSQVPPGHTEECKFDYCASQGNQNQLKEDEAAYALGMTVQHWGVFGTLRIPGLRDLSSSMQGYVAVLMAGFLASAIVRFTIGRPEGVTHHKPGWLRTEEEEEESEALLAPAYEHEALLA